MATPEDASAQPKDPADMTDEELEAAQRAIDGEASDTDPDTDAEEDEVTDAVPQPTPAPTPEPTPAPTPEPTPAPTPAPQADANGGKPEGVQSKDGTRVLPYGALQAARQAAARAERRAERAEKELATAKQQFEDLKSGKTPIADVTEEDVKQMEADFPDQGKKLRALWEKAQAAPAAKPTEDDPEGDDPAAKTQELIDQVPMLLKWQHEDPEKFQRAIEVDAVYNKSPKWKGKDPAERFDAVARFVADEYGIEYEKPKASSTQPPAATPAPSAAPTPAAPDAARRNPETLSDFKHGTTPDHDSLNVARTSAPALLSKFEAMSDEEIDAQLAKLG